MPGPYITMATFCEKVLQEADGVLSVIRIIERVALHNVISGYSCDPGMTNPCSGQPEACPGVYFRPCALATRGQTAKIVSNTFYPNCVTPAR